MAESSLSNALEELLTRLPPGFFDSLTVEQRAQLWEAGHAVSWKRHPINIRFSLPFLPHRFFLTLVGGAERRSPDRLTLERRLNRLMTIGNFFFFLGVSAFFILLSLGVLILLKSLVEF